MSKPLVNIVMGSKSDLPIMKKAAQQLEDFGISYTINIISAHRAPRILISHVEESMENGIQVFIAGAGGAAHLPGVVAGLSKKPVIGVPIKSSISIDGWDSVLSILQMPSGVPVATVALDAAKNAAILAAQILATSDEELSQKLDQFKIDQREKVLRDNSEVMQEMPKV